MKKLVSILYSFHLAFKSCRTKCRQNVKRRPIRDSVYKVSKCGVHSVARPLLPCWQPYRNCGGRSADKTWRSNNMEILYYGTFSRFSPPQSALSLLLGLLYLSLKQSSIEILYKITDCTTHGYTFSKVLCRL